MEECESSSPCCDEYVNSGAGDDDAGGKSTVDNKSMSHGCALSRVLKSTKHFIQEIRQNKTMFVKTKNGKVAVVVDRQTKTKQTPPWQESTAAGMTTP